MSDENTKEKPRPFTRTVIDGEDYYWNPFKQDWVLYVGSKMEKLEYDARIEEAALRQEAREREENNEQF